MKDGASRSFYSPRVTPDSLLARSRDGERISLPVDEIERLELREVDDAALIGGIVSGVALFYFIRWTLVSQD